MPPPVKESESVQFVREAENADRRDEVKLLYDIQLKLKSEHEKGLTQNLTILWAMIMGQCTLALEEEVHGQPDYMSKLSTFDSVWLLQFLQNITAGLNKTTNKYHSAFKATKKFYSTKQSPTEGVDEFYNRFENAKDLVTLFNADIVVDLTSLLAYEQKINPSTTEETTMQKFLAIALIMSAIKIKYASLWNELDKIHIRKQLETRHIYSPIGKPAHQHQPSAQLLIPPTIVGEEQLQASPQLFLVFLTLPTNNDFSALAGFDPAWPTLASSRKPPHNVSADIKCNKKGHYATACPFIIAPALFQYFEFARPSVQLNQSQTQSIFLPGSIIVDSGSIFNCFCKRTLISDIHTCDPFNMFSNGGGMTYTDKGTINIFKEHECYYNPEF